MAFVFGVSNCSPDSVMNRLERMGFIESTSDVAILGHNTRLAAKRCKFPVVFCLTVDDFLRNLTILNSPHFVDVKVFVFGSPLRLSELNVAPLDYEPDRTTACSFVLKQMIDISILRKHLRRPQEAVKRSNGKYLENMMQAVTVGSVLKDLMGHIYTMGNAEQQFGVKMACCKWIAVKPTLDIRVLVKALAKLPCPPKDEKVRRLCEILSSEETANMRKMFAAMLDAKDDGKPASVKNYAKKFGVQEFEVNYIRAVLRDNETKAA